MRAFQWTRATGKKSMTMMSDVFIYRYAVFMRHFCDAATREMTFRTRAVDNCAKDAK